MLDTLIYRGTFLGFLFFACLVAFVCGGVAALALFRRRVKDIGRPRTIEAVQPAGSRSAIVEVEGDHGTLRMRVDDAQAAHLSDRLLYIASVLAPRDADGAAPVSPKGA
jgi:membrane protein implicated in regulation of membrane protease activity